ncbi:MAG: hypothetical protein WD029_11035 [Microthrixaceae bacterium]
MRSLWLFLLGASAVLLLASCQMESVVEIIVEEGGSGTVNVTVRLDAEAAQKLGDPVTAVRLEDLAAAGWSVDAPKQLTEGPKQGGLSFVVRRKFGSPDELALVLAEIGGGPEQPNPVFSDVQLELSDGFAKTNYKFSSVINLTGSLEQFSDADLTAVLGGLPLARTPEELQAEGLRNPEAATLSLRVRMPGKLDESTGRTEGNTAVWEFPMSGGTPSSTNMTSASTATQAAPLRLLIAAIALFVIAGIFGCVGFLRRRS